MKQKKIKKMYVISIMIVVFFCVQCAIVRAKEQNDQKNVSVGDMMRSSRATDIQIHPRVQMRGAQKEKFIKEKKRDDIYAVKGKPAKPSVPPVDKETTLAATGVTGAMLSESSVKYAVVIGICDYPDGLTYDDICLSDGDALNMYHALIMEYGFLPENISLLRDMADELDGDVKSKSATYDNIKSAVDHVRSVVDADDEVIFFFSGHGVTGIYDDGDAEVKKNNPDEAILVHNGVDQYAYIWDGDLRQWFSDFATERITFVFDTCRADGMNDVMQNVSVSDNGPIFVAATSEKGTAYVYSSGEAGEGIFSHYFVNNGMRGYVGPGGGWADGYNQIGWDDRMLDGWLNGPVIGQDGYVVVEEAYEYAREKVANYYSDQIVTIKDLFKNDNLLGEY